MLPDVLLLMIPRCSQLLHLDVKPFFSMSKIYIFCNPGMIIYTFYINMHLRGTHTMLKNASDGFTGDSTIHPPPRCCLRIISRLFRSRVGLKNILPNALSATCCSQHRIIRPNALSCFTDTFACHIVFETGYAIHYSKMWLVIYLQADWRLPMYGNGIRTHAFFSHFCLALRNALMNMSRRTRCQPTWRIMPYRSTLPSGS